MNGKRIASLSVLFVLSLLLRTSQALLPRHSPHIGVSSVGPLDRRHLALVINSDDPLSEEIGVLYQQLRHIPPQQVIRVRFKAGITNLEPSQFRTIRREVMARSPKHVQIYALAWPKPYRVGCQSITSAFAFGLSSSFCADGCHTTRINPYYARGDVRRPWDELRIRPTILLAATSPSDAKRLFLRGVVSDGTAPPGTAYLMSTSDPARNSRAYLFHQVALANAPGFRVRVIQGDTLIGVKDVMAYFTGLAWVNGLRSNHFLPGAVGDHLTSFGGRLTDSNQMSALRWLEAGATGSYGTVEEPCSYPAKFPDPGLFLLYYRRGDTLIESYWRSVAMPGQGVFIGEPLARPWPVRQISLSAASDASPRRAR